MFPSNTFLVFLNITSSKYSIENESPARSNFHHAFHIPSYLLATTFVTLISASAISHVEGIGGVNTRSVEDIKLVKPPSTKNLIVTC